MRRSKTSIAALTIALIVASILPLNLVSAANPKTVYVVIAVDTEMANGHTVYIGSSNAHPTFDMSEYSVSPPPAQMSQIFDTSFRNSHVDSLGNTFKMTWFEEMDYPFSQANFVYSTAVSAGVSGYTATIDLMLKNWKNQIQTYGDGIEYHHHFAIYYNIWQR